MSDQFSPDLVDLAFEGLDHGVASVRDSGGPLIPFVLEARPKRTLKRFTAEFLEHALAEALAYAQSKRQEPGALFVLVYDGYLRLPEGDRFDAIYAEAFEADGGEILSFAQRYRPKRPLRGFSAIGNPILIPGDQARLSAADSN